MRFERKKPQLVSEIPELGRIGKRPAEERGGGTAARQVAQTERKRRRSVEVGRCWEVRWRSSAGSVDQSAIED